MTAQVGLQHYLIVGAILFVLGIFAVITRRNAVWILMGVELILNSAALNFAAYSRWIVHQSDPAMGRAVAETGMIGSLLIIILAAAEAAIALAILIGIYRNFRTIETEDLQELRQ
jgi:NADH-quinone oxidoreductase subunit K